MEYSQQLAMHFETEILIEIAMEPHLEKELNLAGFIGGGPRSIVKIAGDAMPIPFAGSVVAAIVGKLAGAKQSTILSRAVADILATVKGDRNKYESTCRSALLNASFGSFEAAFGALRVAASVNDDWARHHHLYGLIHGVQANFEDSRHELNRALASEPYDETRARIHRALGLLEMAANRP